MTAAEVLESLRVRGAQLHLLDGDHLGVAPASVLTDELRSEIRSHKAELIRVLREDPAPLESAPAIEVRQQIGAVLIDSPRFGQVWLALDPCMAGQLQGEESQRTDPRPVLTTENLGHLEGKPPAMIEAVLNTITVFPDARVGND